MHSRQQRLRSQADERCRVGHACSAHHGGGLHDRLRPPFGRRGAATRGALYQRSSHRRTRRPSLDAGGGVWRARRGEHRLAGALRGARDVRWSAYAGIGVLWTTVPAVTWALGRVAGWGVLGGWCSFVVETAICATIYALRWRYGGWRRAYASGHDPSTAAQPMAVMG